MGHKQAFGNYGLFSTSGRGLCLCKDHLSQSLHCIKGGHAVLPEGGLERIDDPEVRQQVVTAFIMAKINRWK